MGPLVKKINDDSAEFEGELQNKLKTKPYHTAYKNTEK
jgi:hypothetical protein